MSKIISIGTVHQLRDPDSEITAELIDYGATLTKLIAQDKEGKLQDVILGCPTPADHLKPHPHFNCLVGRYANRITNSRFELDGVLHELDANIPPHQLHGGHRGFANRLWSSKPIDHGVRFELISEDGDQGFPGELAVQADYTLKNRVLRLKVTAETTKPSPVSLTAHHYFNLSGEQGSSIDSHYLKLHADAYLAVSPQLTQLGEIRFVQGTPFDFRTAKQLANAIHSSHPQIQLAGGLDHNFVIRGEGLRDAAELFDPVSRRYLKVRTNQPGMQVYTCNTLSAEGKERVSYDKYQGICLETQQFPDAPNHEHYPNSILRPGDVFEAVTEFSFDIR